MKQTKFIVIGIVVIVLGLLTAGVYGAYRLVHQLTPAQILQNETARNFIRDNLPKEKQVFFDMLPELVGLDKPKTYLVLFENNTELRPTGGFIGSFAVVRVFKGSFELLTVQGSEQLDWRSLPAGSQKPPKPIEQYLGVPYWYVRDANWSPDFSASVPDILRLYAQEKGPYAEDIDMVVAITASVFVDVLKDIGPLTVEGKTFNAENAIELLQYDTSYDYERRGIPHEDRKRILDGLVSEVIKTISKDPIGIAPKILATLSIRAKEGHVMLYSTDIELQKQFSQQGVAGEVASFGGDYLLWVDANLAALKTDSVIDRSLSYSLKNNDKKQYLGNATMKYVHNGVFDWRTTRYLTYARVFVPKGSVLVGVSSIDGSGKEKKYEDKDIGTGEELGKQWFGVYYKLEPGQTGSVTFEYILPQSVIKKPYTLFVQKQLGTEAPGLTLDLQFGTTVQSATPAEAQDSWYDSNYSLVTDLRVSRDIKVGF